MYRIILADGTEIDELSKNGSNYISLEQIDESIFVGNLSEVTFVNDEDESDVEVLHNAELIQQIEYNDKYWLCFRELSERELKDREIDSNIEELNNSLTQTDGGLIETYEKVLETETSLEEVNNALMELYEMITGEE